ncbi:MAG: hypothetical protein AAF674_13870 [Pseudomonadota bacterium]
MSVSRLILLSLIAMGAFTALKVATSVHRLIGDYQQVARMAAPSEATTLWAADTVAL